jgi:beta-galactosidase
MDTNLENTVNVWSTSCDISADSINIVKVNNLGPQTTYPVPEGILNNDGRNYLALTLWALDEEGAKIDGLDLVPSTPIFSGYQRPESAPQPAWERRPGAY